MKTIGVIGGSGLYQIENLSNIKSIKVETPFGEPSDDLVSGRIGDVKLVFLPRHGRGHTIMPSEINYRANIYAMKKLGVQSIISVSAVGSMKEGIAPGDVVIPLQFIDYTKKRVSTFFGDGIVAHASMADPVCPLLSDALYKSAKESGATVHIGGTYICIEGPQFSSRAESNIYRKWGVDIIGMTNMPEAKLAREAEICYSTLALSTDYDCWHEDHKNVTVEDVITILNQNVELSKKVIQTVISKIPQSFDCSCKSSLKNAIITSRDSISEEAKNRLDLIIGKYFK